MPNFSIGNRWDYSFLHSVDKLNQRFSSGDFIVNELYGSLRSVFTGLSSARPDFRIPDFPIKEIKKYIKKAHDYGLRINYTINAPLNLSLKEFELKLDNIRRSILKLIDFGVDIFTVANTLLIEYINEISDIPIEISSVLHPQSTAQIKIYKDWNVKQICMDPVRNRDILFLYNFNKVCVSNGIKLKLLVNELCNIKGAPCSGLYQADCVMHSSLGGNLNGLFNNWPFERCSKSRQNDPLSYLKSHFILPQWIKKYSSFTKITNYKITGRTCDTSWLLNVVESYLSQNYTGDVSALWVDPGLNFLNPSYSEDKDLFVINASHLEEINFIDFWFDNPSFRCNEHCEFDCNYCEKTIERLKSLVMNRVG